MVKHKSSWKAVAGKVYWQQKGLCHPTAWSSTCWPGLRWLTNNNNKKMFKEMKVLDDIAPATKCHLYLVWPKLFLIWSPLMKRHLSNRLLLSVFQSSFLHILQVTIQFQWTFCVGSFHVYNGAHHSHQLAIPQLIFPECYMLIHSCLSRCAHRVSWPICL